MQGAPENDPPEHDLDFSEYDRETIRVEAIPASGWRDGLAAWQRRLRAAGLVLRFVAAGGLVAASGLSAPALEPVEAVRAAREAAAQGALTEAVGYYHEACRYEPWASAHLTSAIPLSIAAGDYDAAAADLERLARSRDLTAEEWVWAGAVYAGQGRTEDAAAAYETAWAQGAKDPAGLHLLADWYREAERLEAEQAALAALAETGEASGAALLRLGMLQALSSPYEATLTLSQAAAVDDAVRAQAAVLLAALDEGADEPPEQAGTRLGAALIGVGEPTLAAIILERAAVLNVNYAESLAYLAYAYALLDRPALGAAMQAKALAPDSPLVLYLVGRAWMEAGDTYQARLALERAFTLDPANPALAAEVANTHRADGNNGLAEYWIEEMLDLAGDDFRFRLIAAQFYVDEEYRVAEVGLPLAEALTLENPESAAAHATLGWGYFLTGEIGRAFEELDRALALEPTLLRALVHKGAVLESQQRTAEAVSYYRQALALDPEGPYGAFATRALERIGEP